jgi:hypothetical protein
LSVATGGATSASSSSSSSSCRARPLGLLSGEIKDWQLGASSVVSRAVDADCAVKHARLHAPGKRAWCPENLQQGEWILADLGVQSEVSGVMTQGRDTMDQWVTHFYISYSEDAYRYVSVQCLHYSGQLLNTSVYLMYRTLNVLYTPARINRCRKWYQGLHRPSFNIESLIFILPKKSKCGLSIFMGSTKN